eukprot:TRINITY_DN18416_c0_g1_i1.p1 TRINITY_DN18416_c0_g1~~TRINITY_DN18416_c0_g1_i1.p1  ORF type:complete len:193 (-),score=21.49 TRINITY_DN18416_c0_g1_i1:134-712(-)
MVNTSEEIIEIDGFMEENLVVVNNSVGAGVFHQGSDDPDPVSPYEVMREDVISILFDHFWKKLVPIISPRIAQIEAKNSTSGSPLQRTSPLSKRESPTARPRTRTNSNPWKEDRPLMRAPSERKELPPTLLTICKLEPQQRSRKTGWTEFPPIDPSNRNRSTSTSNPSKDFPRVGRPKPTGNTNTSSPFGPG